MLRNFMLLIIAIYIANRVNRHTINIDTTVILYCFLIIFSLTSSYINLPIVGFDSPRLPLVFIIAFIWRRKISHTLSIAHKANLLIPVLLYWVYLTISITTIANNINMKELFEVTGNFITMLLTATFILYADRREIKIVVLTMALALIFNTILYSDSYFLFLRSFNFPDGHGTTHQSSGQAAMYALPLFMFLIDQNRKIMIIGKILLWCSLFVAMIGVYISGARTPLLASAIIYLIWIIRNKKYILSLPLIILGNLLLPSGSADFTQNRIERLYQAIASERPKEAGEFAFRMRQVELSLEMYKNDPFFGIGHGSWLSVRNTSISVIGEELQSHNGWALALAEYGTIGMLLLINFYYSQLKNSWRNSGNDINNRLLYAGISGIIAIFIMNLGGVAFFNRIGFYYTGILTGTKLRVCATNTYFRKPNS